VRSAGNSTFCSKLSVPPAHSWSRAGLYNLYGSEYRRALFSTLRIRLDVPDIFAGHLNLHWSHRYYRNRPNSRWRLRTAHVVDGCDLGDVGRRPCYWRHLADVADTRNRKGQFINLFACSILTDIESDLLQQYGLLIVRNYVCVFLSFFFSFVLCHFSTKICAS